MTTKIAAIGSIQGKRRRVFGMRMTTIATARSRIHERANAAILAAKNAELRKLNFCMNYYVNNSIIINI